MFAATQAKEIVVKTSSWVGAFKEISKLVAERGIGILAISFATHGITGIVRMVTDDNLRAKDVLNAHDFAPREDDIIALELAHKPGLLRQMTLRLEEANIDIRHLYASAPTSADRCLVVFDTTDNARALVELNRTAAAVV